MLPIAPFPRLKLSRIFVVGKPACVVVAVGVGEGVGVAVLVGVRVTVDVAVGVDVKVTVEVVVGVRLAVEVGVSVGEGVGVFVGLDPLVVSRKSSNAWSLVLDCRVKLVTGFVQPVTSVWGLFPDVVIFTSGLPELLNVNVLLPLELTRMLLTITGRGNKIDPCEPPLVI